MKASFVMSYKKAANAAWLKCAGQAEPRRARGAIASACGGLGIAQPEWWLIVEGYALEFHRNDINDIPIFKAISGKVDRRGEGDL